MSTYKEMYLTLAHAQRDAILILQEAHQKAEEMLLSAEVPDHLRVVRLESDGAPTQEVSCDNEIV
ncbi:MAG: hypothetical protein FWE28_02365 [Oscillospiraceae bacterium]|nr:hypothetical protein [Oscillospiraceae bacterium]